MKFLHGMIDACIASHATLHTQYYAYIVFLLHICIYRERESPVTKLCIHREEASGNSSAVKENRYSKKKERKGKNKGKRRKNKEKGNEEKEKKKYRQTGDCAHFQPSPEA